MVAAKPSGVTGCQCERVWKKATREVVLTQQLGVVAPAAGDWQLGDSLGVLYISDRFNHRIRRINLGGNITSSKVGHRIDTSDLCNLVWVTDLQRKSRIVGSGRSVPDGLTMAANGLNRACWNTQ